MITFGSSATIHGFSAFNSCITIIHLVYINFTVRTSFIIITITAMINMANYRLLIIFVFTLLLVKQLVYLHCDIFLLTPKSFTFVFSLQR